MPSKRSSSEPVDQQLAVSGRAVAASRPSSASASPASRSSDSVRDATGQGSTLSETSSRTPSVPTRRPSCVRRPSGDVLHDLAAESQHPAVAGEDPDTEHVVAQRTEGRARRTGEAAGDGAADGRRLAEGGRFERQSLALRRERVLDVAEWRARPGGDHQFRGS